MAAAEPITAFLVSWNIRTRKRNSQKKKRTRGIIQKEGKKKNR